MKENGCLDIWGKFTSTGKIKLTKENLQIVVVALSIRNLTMSKKKKQITIPVRVTSTENKEGYNYYYRYVSKRGSPTSRVGFPACTHAR